MRRTEHDASAPRIASTAGSRLTRNARDNCIQLGERPTHSDSLRGGPKSRAQPPPGLVFEYGHAAIDPRTWQYGVVLCAAPISPRINFSGGQFRSMIDNWRRRQLSLSWQSVQRIEHAAVGQHRARVRRVALPCRLAMTIPPGACAPWNADHRRHRAANNGCPSTCTLCSSIRMSPFASSRGDAAVSAFSLYVRWKLRPFVRALPACRASGRFYRAHGRIIANSSCHRRKFVPSSWQCPCATTTCMQYQRPVNYCPASIPQWQCGGRTAILLRDEFLLPGRYSGRSR